MDTFCVQIERKRNTKEAKTWQQSEYASTHHLLFRHLSQIINKHPKQPCWGVVDQSHDNRKMAEDVGEPEILLGGLEIRFAPVVFIEEMETVAECVSRDYVARVGFENGVQVQDLAVLGARLTPAREHHFQVFFDDGFDSTDAGD